MSIPKAAAAELDLFIKAGETQEVPLNTLLMLLTPESVERIKGDIVKQAMMVKIGMTMPTPAYELAARVAAYMGWLRVEE